jgi:hypothetical protein
MRRIGRISCPGRSRFDLRPVGRDHPDLDRASLLAQPQHRFEQLADRAVVPAAKLRDRQVIRHPHRRDQLVGHVLAARPLNPAGGHVPARVRVEQKRDHHRRLIRRAPLTVLPIRPVERAQVHLRDRPEDRPHQMMIRHPIRQIRRHQQRLPPITRNEVLSHPGIFLTRPDDTLYPTADLLVEPSAPALPTIDESGRHERFAGANDPARNACKSSECGSVRSRGAKIGPFRLGEGNGRKTTKTRQPERSAAHFRGA